MATKQQTEFLDKIKEEQEQVLSLLRSDWELGCSVITGNYWMQRGGLGSGDISKNFHFRTIETLLETDKIKIIRKVPRLPTLYALK